MRIQQLYAVALILILGLPGCASKRRQEVDLGTTDPQSQNAYWADTDCNSGSCDETTVSPTVEQKPLNRWNPFAKRSDKQIIEGSLTCQGCQSKHDVLVDGMCVQCLKQQMNGTVFDVSNGAEKLSKNKDRDDWVTTRERSSSELNSSQSARTELSELNVQLDLPGNLPGIKLPKIDSGLTIIPAKIEKSAKDFVGKLDEAKNELAESATKKYESSLDSLKSVREDSELAISNKLPLKTQSGGRSENSNGDIELEKQTDKSSKKLGLSAGASVMPDPKFETFKLDELFDEETNQENEKSNQESLRRKKDQLQLENSTEPDSVSTEYLRRSEESIVRDLENSTVPNTVVFDNTPLIPEQMIANKQIVLSATPVESYHQIRRIAKTRKNPAAEVQLPTTLARDDEGEPRSNGLRAIPVKSQRVIEQEQVNPDQSYDFSPLPVLKAIVEEVDVSSASSIDDEVYEPYAFPDEQVEQQEDPNLDDPTFEFNGSFDSLSPGESNAEPPRAQDPGNSRFEVSALPPLTWRTDETKIQTTDSVNGSIGILLRAIPKSHIGNAAGGQAVPQKSKASFRFIRPKFQRVIDE